MQREIGAMPDGNLCRVAKIISDLFNLPYNGVLEMMTIYSVIDHNVVATNRYPLVGDIIGEIPENVALPKWHWIEWLRNHIYYRLTGWMIDLLDHLPEFNHFSGAEVIQWAANFAYVVAYKMRVDGYLRVSNGFTMVDGSDNLVFRFEGRNNVRPGSFADFPDPDDWFDYNDNDEGGLGNSSVLVCGCPEESCECATYRPADWVRVWRPFKLTRTTKTYCNRS